LLKSNKSLKSLNISNNTIKHRGAKLVCSAIKENNTLEEIDLSKNFFGFEKKGVKYLADALKYHPSIKYVNISENDIRDVGCFMLCNMLKENKVLERLDISQNSMTAEAIDAIIEALKINDTLKQLTLGDVALPDPPKGEAKTMQLKDAVEDLRKFCLEEKPDFILSMEGWPPFFVTSFLEMEKLK